jgi:hypothetical protein
MFCNLVAEVDRTSMHSTCTYHIYGQGSHEVQCSACTAQLQCVLLLQVRQTVAEVGRTAMQCTALAHTTMIINFTFSAMLCMHIFIATSAAAGAADGG